MLPITTFAILTVAVRFFLYTMYCRLYPMVKAGFKNENRFARLWDRIKGTFIYAFGQKRLLTREGGYGLMHAFVFWGFMTVSLRTILLFGEGFNPDFGQTFVQTAFGQFYVWTKNIFEVFVLVAIVALLYRRLVVKPKRLPLSAEGIIILSAIATLMVTDFFLELAPTKTDLWYGANYFIHSGTVLAFLNYLPYGKHFHIITAIPNVFFQRLTPYGALDPLNLEDEKATTFGLSDSKEMNWKQMLDVYSCTECGRCDSQCPATATGKKLKPRLIAMAMREHLEGNAFKKNSAPMVPGSVDPEMIWDCTTCRACEEACPVLIEYVDKIVGVRRNLVLMRGEFPKEAQATLKKMETNSNPWGFGFDSRGDWAKDLGVNVMAENKEVEYLYFVGCAGSFDERAKKVSRALVKCLQTAGVSFAILGKEEKCTGDSARRIGNEYLFQTMAKDNIATFNRYGVRKIITTCPHCFNTIKNEYPQFKGNYEVIHHTELLRDLIAAGKLKPTKPLTDGAITFHDSCYLGRYNNIYEAPRDVLKAIPGVQYQEMQLSKDQGRCCGAGGGRMWMEETVGTKINLQRMEDVRTQTSAETVASSCPFCLTMLTDATKKEENAKIKTKDIAELVAESLA